MGVSRASLYYAAKQPAKDWALKIRIEEEAIDEDVADEDVVDVK